MCERPTNSGPLGQRVLLNRERTGGPIQLLLPPVLPAASNTISLNNLVFVEDIFRGPFFVQ